MFKSIQLSGLTFPLYYHFHQISAMKSPMPEGCSGKISRGVIDQNFLLGADQYFQFIMQVNGKRGVRQKYKIDYFIVLSFC